MGPVSTVCAAAISACLPTFIASPSGASPVKRGAVTTVQSHALRPQRLPWSPALVQRLKAPPGFRVSVFAHGLKNPRMLAVAPGGTVYVTRPKQGDVMMLRDADGDGSAEIRRFWCPVCRMGMASLSAAVRCISPRSRRF